MDSSEPQASQWEIRFSQSRQRPYFYSTNNKTSVWDAPPEFSTEELMKLPGAHFLHGAVTGGGLGGALAPDAGGSIRASHILIKHANSRRPSSWKETQITRTQSEAIEILKEHEEILRPLNGIQLNEKFQDLAKVHSDCSSYSHGGDLGQFKKGQMQKSFEEVSFQLQIGELSKIVTTDSGVHLILRTA
ncbi:uncharacterized protein MELLADRAFT_111323 [Melampsora larici-populina 98AG31]|uniref:Peptidyl-prolyl cis-trans isomerase n=1 Tax=Melampsora larici-populina (strain 98AG31 / pathotype 3-4-7) TaxID=747676 RepID=F4S2S4_MELLP|nr:uncharacterized protein MELLADRAFT_111323 [Melampsora larici-populina 98AG31]EGG01050.1 hypothetical protein MELLADRAFT_111323 [Melampsora larici-populina 98AG31]